MQPASFQTYVTFYILGKTTNTYNRLYRKYMMRFIFWMKKQVHATGYVVNKRCASYYR